MTPGTILTLAAMAMLFVTTGICVWMLRSSAAHLDHVITELKAVDALYRSATPTLSKGDAA